jgi:microsomal dipeptidase-like Zn-dependent dipeptidase
MKLWPLLLAVALVLGPLPLFGAQPEPLSFAVVDLRVHLPFQAVSRGRSLRDGSGQADVRRMRAGGVYGVVLPVLGPLRSEPRAARLEPAYLALYRALVQVPELRLPGCRRRGSGFRTWLAIEGAGELSRAPSSAGLWVTRGVKLFGLVRNEDNELATSSSTPPPVLTGLTAQGKMVVSAIHAAGGIVDVSHASEMTVRDVVELARADGAVVVASHSNARAITDHPRNLSDDEITAIASTGGVVGITFAPGMLARGRRPNLTDVVRHVRHVARVGGIDHVALGSGFEGGIWPPHELINASRYPRLMSALLAAGMTPEDVRKVASKNALRVLCPNRP